MGVEDRDWYRDLYYRPKEFRQEHRPPAATPEAWETDRPAPLAGFKVLAAFVLGTGVGFGLAIYAALYQWPLFRDIVKRVYGWTN